MPKSCALFFHARPFGSAQWLSLYKKFKSPYTPATRRAIFVARTACQKTSRGHGVAKIDRARLCAEPWQWRDGTLGQSHMQVWRSHVLASS
jgi:hypothetical protein